ncbi:MAG: hypothetical protein V4487_01375 [Chlamydiota bacterium]
MANLPSVGAGAGIQLNHYFTEIPEKNASKLRHKALAYNVLAKITFVAILAITAAILAVSFGLGTVTGALPIVLVGLAILTPFLAIGASRLTQRSNEYSQLAATEKGVAEELKKIADWKTAEIELFFNTHGLPRQNLPMDALQILNPQEPLRAFLPLIARFNYLNAKRVALDAAVKENLNTAIAHEEVRLAAERIGWQILEREMIPYALNAALMLQIISQPTLQLKLSDLGTCQAKSLEGRLAAREFRQDDNYFVFNEQNRAPLVLTQLRANNNPGQIRQQFFPAPLPI